MTSFSCWKGPNGIEKFIMDNTGCKPFNGVGISVHLNKDTIILRSVDNTYYYDDNLSNIDNIHYTLFGHNGDQDENEKKFNRHLLASSNIYLYRVAVNGNKRTYKWYGKYNIITKYSKLHIGKDYKPRIIILLSLQKTNV